MAKMRFFLLVPILLFAVFINAKFSIISKTSNSMNIKYSVSDEIGAKAVLIPPIDNIDIQYSPSRIINKVQTKPVYFGDYHILPLVEYTSDYTITISYPTIPKLGRIVLQEQSFINAVSDLIINPEHMKDFIKRRNYFAYKSSYSGTPVLKIKVDSTGIYRMYSSQLATVSSEDLSSIDPTKIQCFNGNSEIPLYINNIDDSIFNTGDFIEFFAERKEGEDNRYFDKYNIYNNYVLTVNGNNGARYVHYSSPVSHDSLIESNVYDCIKTMHIEEDSFYYRFTTINPDTSDFWFDRYMTDPNDYNIDMQLINRIAGNTPINMRTAFHGISRLGINPDHPIDIFINDSLISSINWNDQFPYFYENDSIFIGDTLSALITYRINAVPGDTSTSDSFLFNSVLLNWTEIDYKKSLITNNDYITFNHNDNLGFGRFRFHIDGLSTSNIEILRKDFKIIEDFIVQYDSLELTYSVIFEDDIFSTGVEYGVYERSHIFSPSEILPYYDGSLTDNSNRGKYIIITPQPFKDAANEITMLFEEDVFIAGSEEIYNEFSYGLISPDAIRDFLKAAYNSWDIPPTHVLLLGDASRDQNNHLGKKENIIPNTYFYGLGDYGYSCTDNYYARVVGDDVLEDISISRYPANNISDIYNLKTKIIHYIDPRNQGTHNLRALMVYDTTDYLRCESDSRSLGDILPSYLYPHYMRTYETWSTDFINEFNRGAFFVNALAHGATRSVGYGQFLKIYDVYRYNNINRLPLINVFSCTTNEYDFVSSDTMSIGEAFVLAPNGGAIAYYGATGTSEAGINNLLANAIVRQFSNKGIKNIGDVLRLGEIEFFLEVTDGDPNNMFFNRSQEIMNYNLLGINFLDLNYPILSEKEIELSSETLTPGDTLTVSVESSEVENGNFECLVLDQSKDPISHSHSEIFDSSGTVALVMPDSIEMGNLTVLSIASSSDTSVLYISYPSVGSVGLSSFGISPASPDTNQAFIIYARIKNQTMLKNQYVYYKKDTPGSNYLFLTLQMSPDDSTLFISDSIDALKALNIDYSFLYYISLTDTIDNVYNTSKKSYFVNSLPDIIIENDSISITSIDRHPYINAIINNYYERDIPPFNNAYYMNNDTIIFCIDSCNGIGRSEYISKALIKEDVFIDDLRIKIDVDNNIAEKNETNNEIMIDSFNHKIILFEDTLTEESVDFYSYKINMLNKSKNLGSFIDLSVKNIDELPEGMNLYQFTGYTSYQEYCIFNGDTNKCEIGIEFNDSLLKSNEWNFYTYSEEIEKYEIIKEGLNNINTNLISGNNRFIIATHSDTISPHIDIIIENKDYVGNVVLTEQCELAFTIEDESGIKTDDIVIVLNNDTIPSNEYIIAENTDLRNIPLKLTKQLTDGTYKVEIYAKDIYNNETVESLEFKVAQTFAIISAGNFPNPATGDNTVIACRLSEQASEVILYLFDARSRKLLRESIYPGLDLIVTYNLSTNGFSNGTYFYYFEALKENGSESVKSAILKMSILK